MVVGSAAGVELAVDVFEAFLVDVGVDLGGSDVGVAEEFLDDAQVGAVLQEVGGERVAEEVWVDVGFDAGEPGAVADDLADAFGGERGAIFGDEDVVAGFTRDEFRAFVGEVVGDGGEGFGADGDDAGFVTFAGDADGAGVVGELVEGGVDQFGDA